MKYGKSFDSSPVSFETSKDVQVWFVLYKKGSLLPEKGTTKTDDAVGWMISREPEVVYLISEEFNGEESVDSFGNCCYEFLWETPLEKILEFLKKNRIELEEKS